MDLDNLLSKIQRVEAPPYLFTRIQQKIAQTKNEAMPIKTALAIKLSFAVLLIVNIVVLSNYNTKSNATESYAESIHLISNNSLYK